MSSSFTIRSAAGVLVSLLNPVDISPVDSIHYDRQASFQNSSDDGGPKKEHVCSECGRSFSTMGHLNRHITMHTGHKEHVCPVLECGKSASRGDNLVQHYRTHLPRGEHNRCTSYIRAKMVQKMQEVGTSPIRKPRGRKDEHVSLRHVFGYSLPSPALTADRLTPPSRRNSMSSQSSMSQSLTPTSRTEGSSSAIPCSPSPPLLTPPGRFGARYAEQDHYFSLHHGFHYAGEPAYHPSACLTDYSRNLPVSNARGE